jgi:hypothetical protein
MCWFRTPASWTSQEIFNVEQGSVFDTWRASGSTEAWGIDTNSTDVGGSGPSLSTWYHLTCQRTGNTRRLYVNGVLDITNSVATTLNAPDWEGWGGHSGSSLALTGRIGAVKQWDAILTTDEILAEMQFYLPVRQANLHTVAPFIDNLNNLTGGTNYSQRGTVSFVDGPPIAYDPVLYRAGWTNIVPSTSLSVATSAVAGDTLVAWAISDSDPVSFTWPSGFVEVQRVITTLTDTGTLGVAIKANATGSEGTLNIGATSSCIGGIAAFSGASATTPLDVAAVWASAYADPSPSVVEAGPIITANPGCAIVAVMMTDKNSTGTADAAHVFTSSGGVWTTRQDLDNGTGSHFYQGALGTMYQAAAGTTGFITGTSTGASQTADVSMIVLALRPASGVEPAYLTPGLRDVTGAGDTSGSSATVNVTKPAGVAVGDLLVAHFTSIDSVAVTHGVPTGFTLINSQAGLLVGGSFSARSSMYYRVADGSEGSSWTFTATSGVQAGLSARIACFYNTETSSPLDDEASGKVESNGTPITLGQVTTTRENDLLVAGVYCDGGGLGTVFSSSDMSEFWDADATSMLMKIEPVIDALTDAYSVVNATSGYRYHHIAAFKALANPAIEVPTVEQEGFRFYEDDGDEDGSTALAAQDTGASIALDTNVVLRVLLNGEDDPATAQYQLEYREVGGGDWVPVAGAPAAPTYVDVGTNTSGAGNITVPWPTHVAGDIGLLVIESTGGQAANLGTANGFAAVDSSPSSTGATTSGTRVTVYWCRATSAAMASPIVTDPGDHAVGRIFTFRGCVETGDPWNITAADQKASASTSASAPTVTTTVNNCLIVCAISRDNDASSTTSFSAWANASLTDVNEAAEGGTTSGNGGGFGVGYGTLATAGVSGVTTATVTSSINASITIALLPKAVQPIVLSASANITAGGVDTTARLTAPAGKSTGDFTAGRLADDENPLDTIDLADDEYTEVAWCIKAQTPAELEEVYEFRVTAAGVALDTYSVTPELTLEEEGGPVEEEPEESVAAGESYANAIVVFNAQSESVAAGESYADDVVVFEAPSESVAITDTQPEITVRPEAYSESAEVGETLAEGVVLANLLTESATAGESLDDEVTVHEAPTESAEAGESLVEITVRSESLSESLEPAEASVDNVTVFEDPEETADTGEDYEESVEGGATVISEEPEESLEAGATTVDSVVVFEPLSETAEVGEALPDAVIVAQAPAESAAVEDTVADAIVALAPVSESLAPSDDLSTGVTFGEFLAESAAATDFYLDQVEGAPTIVSEEMLESIAIDEGTTQNATVQEGTSESAGVGDAQVPQSLAVGEMVEIVGVDEEHTTQLLAHESLAEFLAVLDEWILQLGDAFPHCAHITGTVRLATVTGATRSADITGAIRSAIVNAVECPND